MLTSFRLDLLDCAGVSVCELEQATHRAPLPHLGVRWLRDVLFDMLGSRIIDEIHDALELVARHDCDPDHLSDCLEPVDVIFGRTTMSEYAFRHLRTKAPSLN